MLIGEQLLSNGYRGYAKQKVFHQKKVGEWLQTNHFVSETIFSVMKLFM